MSLCPARGSVCLSLHLCIVAFTREEKHNICTARCWLIRLINYHFTWLWSQLSGWEVDQLECKETSGCLLRIFSINKSSLANSVHSILHAISEAAAWKGFSICLWLSISMSRTQTETRPSTIKTRRWWVLHLCEHEIWLITIIREQSIPGRASLSLHNQEGERRKRARETPVTRYSGGT